jgi:hypothetical protein
MGASKQASPPRAKRQWIPSPVFRQLRVFAIDPSIAARFETGMVNEETLRIPWEKLEPGPIGEYVAVVDRDEEGRKVAGAVDLDDPEVLAQQGLAPSDGNPQFRHQMVYAVAMETIRNFERALGRPVHWTPETGENGTPVYRPRLDLYPHHSELGTAYYDRWKGLCFGYFTASEKSPFPGSCVFTCLSQDVIAHELTHALLEGMNIQVGPETYEDARAFHEGFATLVSLLQHFRNGDVLRHQIAAVRGDLRGRSLLGVVAPQLGAAYGVPDGIANVLGESDEQGNWRPRKPDPELLATLEEAHERGGVLVAAVFEAFRKIYDSRIADLRRIASKGTGTLPEGDLHPDLVGRLTREAGQIAGHVLDMCIRALDYLPPVAYTFGDYLRAIVTADYDLFPVDARNYRLAFVDAFRSWGIHPPDLVTLSMDTLTWPEPAREGGAAAVLSAFVQELSKKHSYWNLPRDRNDLWELLEGWKQDLTQRLTAASGDKDTRSLGAVDLRKEFDILSFDLRTRAGYEGDLLFQWVVKIEQRPGPAGGHTAGTTVLVDAETGRVRLQIEKRQSRKSSGRGASESLLERASEGRAAAPVTQRLRVFAVDPGLGVQLETAGINEVVLEVPWEDDLKPGPVSEYLEVVDRDPASGCSYAPVDLRDRSLLAADGLTPSESNPQFHQQMAYAVAMRTIRSYERALGRLALWSPRRGKDEAGEWKDDEYVQRLRLYPHALREANAYYSPPKKAVLFGYFPAPVEDNAAGSARLTVFTCVSHDIVAHEVTHALLDGIHRRFGEATNRDMLAFHEAFADIVALFQHFSLPAVLRDQIAATRGDLASQNRLGELARQFGEATGERGALRSAIGTADPEAYERELEPHKRGAILVSAVFDAFLTIYKAQVADLLRIYTEGTGVLPEGRLHPDLVDRLADEAASSAAHVLEMCIRALDYCPPVDLTFGDYLRAVVTADFASDPLDESHRRVAFVEAFRRRGILPEDIRTLSADGLLWQPASEAYDEELVIPLVRPWAVDIGSWNLSKSRSALFEMMEERRADLHAHLAGIRSLLRGLDPSLPTFEVHSIRPSMRFDWNDQPRFQWVVELTQGIYVQGPLKYSLRGGCTLLVDAETGEVRYSIEKRLDKARQDEQRRYILEAATQSLGATYFGSVSELSEPFAAIHRMAP